MVLDKKFIELPEAIRKLTSLPAKQFRMNRRGNIKKSFIADITIFDPESIRDRATYSDPHAIAQGVDAVIVNGCPALLNGSYTGQNAGEFVEAGK